MGLGFERLRGLVLLAALGTCTLVLTVVAPAIGAAEDRTPPATKLTYPPLQDFVNGKTVLVRVRSNESATVIASGQLEVGSQQRSGREIWGLYGVEREVAARAKVELRLRLPRQTREAAARAVAQGRKTVVKVVIDAEDAAGNRSGATVAVIRPKRN
jgi:hypothetical protein